MVIPIDVCHSRIVGNIINSKSSSSERTLSFYRLIVLFIFLGMFFGPYDFSLRTDSSLSFWKFSFFLIFLLGIFVFGTKGVRVLASSKSSFRTVSRLSFLLFICVSVATITRLFKGETSLFSEVQLTLVGIVICSCMSILFSERNVRSSLPFAIWFACMTQFLLLVAERSFGLRLDTTSQTYTYIRNYSVNVRNSNFTGSLNNPNDLSFAILVSAAILITLHFTFKIFQVHVNGVFVYTLVLFAIYISYQNESRVAFLLSTILFIVVAVSKGRLAVRNLHVVFTIAFLTLFFLSQRAKLSASIWYLSDSDFQRLRLFSELNFIVNELPFFGLPSNQAGPFLREFGLFFSDAHNAILYMLLNFGVFCAVIFSLIILTILRLTLQRRESGSIVDYRLRLCNFVTLSCFIGWMFVSSNALASPVFWLLLSAFLGLLRHMYFSLSQP
jgi:hypothetical protein